MKWEKVKLGNVTDSCLGKMLDQNKNKGDYQPYLANVNVRWGEFDLENLPLMKFEESEQERYELKYGDLVICEGGEPGRCAIWKEQIPKDPLIYGFEETVRPFMEQIKNKLQANLKLVEARDRLLPKLMNGEVEA